MGENNKPKKNKTTPQPNNPAYKYETNCKIHDYKSESSLSNIFHNTWEILEICLCIWQQNIYVKNRTEEDVKLKRRTTKVVK